ncbi:M48 family metalloprotease [Streptomyces sp. NPDC051567]|uniref:M48 family metalloprotease n=1 Tax=Streptomyces sp. NPDC051567 TaxID=3365660 RepID=UPI0037B14F6A
MYPAAPAGPLHTTPPAAPAPSVPPVPATPCPYPPHPAAAPAPFLRPPQPPPEAGPYSGGPDDLEYRTAPGTRVVHRARQRGADATAWGQLLLHVPGFLLSLAVVASAAVLLEHGARLPSWLPVLLWTLSGALVFHRPSERLLARHLHGLQHPLPDELAVLTPVWREVTARAGVDGSRYELWIENSGHPNASAAAGHLVGVTRYAVERLPRSQLAAVLAHELGHHTGGHAWSGLLGWWYGLPGRALWWFLLRAAHLVLRSARPSAGRRRSGPALLVLLAGILLTALAGWFAVRAVAALYGLPLVLIGLPCAMAALRRRAELRADAHAAALGFAPGLARMLHDTLAEEEERGGPGSRGRAAFAGAGLLARLLSSHPDHRTRLHHLRPYLRATPGTPQGGHPFG